MSTPTSRTVLLALALFLPVSLFAKSDDRAEVFALYRKANQLKQAGKWKEAVKVYEQAVEKSSKAFGEDHANTATLVNNLAFLHEELADHAKAEPLHERSLAIREKTLGKDHPQVAESLNNLAALHFRLGRYDQARPLFERSLTIREAKLGKDHLLVAATLNNLAMLHSRQGMQDLAERLYQRSLRIKEDRLGKDDPDVATTLSNLGEVHRARGHYGKARATMERALGIRERKLGKGHPSVAYSLNNLALLYTELGEFARAEPYSRRALEIWEKHLGEDHPLVATALNNLALLHENAHQYARAEPLYLRSLAITEKRLGKDHVDLAVPLNNLAAMYWSMGDDKRAESHYLRTIDLVERQRGKDHPYLARTLNNLAELYKTLGNFPRAEPLFERSLAIKEKRLGKDHPDVATSLFNLAGLYVMTDEDAKAGPLLERALKIREVHLGKSHPDVGTTLNNLAMHRFRSGKTDEAFALVDRARRMARRHVAAVLPVLSEAEQLQFLERTERHDLRIALSLALASHDGERSAAWAINAKGQAQESLARSALLARAQTDPARGKQVVELQQLRRRLAAFTYSLPRAGQEKEHARQRQILADREQELARKVRQASSGMVDAEWVELADVRKNLPAGTVLIDVVRVEPVNLKARKGDRRSLPVRYFAWVIAGTGKAQQIDLGPAQAIDEAAARVRKGLQEAARLIPMKGEPAAETLLREDLQRLSNLVAKPLLPHVAGAESWLVSPDGNLWLVPWQALLLADGKYAIEKHRISYLTTPRDLLSEGVAKVGAGAPVLFADPDFDGFRTAEDAETVRRIPGGLTLGRIARLPGTAAEAKAVAPALERYTGREPRLFSRKEATRAAALEVKHPRVLMLATHGFFLTGGEDGGRTKGERALTAADNPLLRCGLLLAGCNGVKDGREPEGVLTGLDVLGMELRGCEMVVLSACETGLGDVQNGEGVAGLRQAFRLAGARSVVSTLWQVPDRSSAALMTMFFANLAKGKDRSSALREAQRKLIEQRREDNAAAHPFFWAAFTLTGR